MLNLFQKMTVTFVLFLSMITAVTAVDQLLGLYDMVKADTLDVNGDTIALGTGCMAIVADTSTERADSIRLGQMKVINDRPTTHDTFMATLDAFNITVDSFRLTRYDGRLYYSDLVLRSRDKVLKLDVRPSDGIAIAVRADAPMYVNKTLLAERGENIC